MIASRVSAYQNFILFDIGAHLFYTYRPEVINVNTNVQLATVNAPFLVYMANKMPAV